jgi:hypothetical protein
MYDSKMTAGEQELLSARLSQAVNELRQKTFSTRQRALAEIYSAINRVLSLGNRMSPLAPIPAFGPATTGNLARNFSILNEDCAAIIEQLLDTENDASGLYNSFAAAQNVLRQAIRERLVASSARSYREPFITDSQIELATATASIDYNAGLATTALLSETFLKPDSYATHPLTAGTPADGSTLEALFDSIPTTSFIWNGEVLDLVLTFTKPTILNTIKLELIGYQGLVIERCSVTADGIDVHDLLAELPAGSRSLDGDSSKFSGDWYALFQPRHVSQLRITIRDIVAGKQIQVRNLILSQRKYGATGQVTSRQISTPLGIVRFAAEGRTAAKLTSITHQISKDRQTYQVIQPGDLLNLTGPFWYRAVLSRLESNFSQGSSPLANPGPSDTYTLGSFTSTDLGGGVVSRKAAFNTVSGSVDLGEQPLAGSVSISVGSTPLAPSAYTLAGSVLTFTTSYSNLALNYMTSAYGLAGLASRQNYFTPYLDNVAFNGA